jgi:predicted amidohydrolase
VVVFPELALCGYDLPALAAYERLTVAADPSGTVSDPRLAPMADAAASGAAVVLAGAAVRRPDGALTNSVLSFGSTGVRVVYDKQHLWHDDEARLFRPGGRGATVTVDDWSFGLAICYDVSFPEHARAAALAGAHAYLCPSAFVAGREHRAAIYLAARALENTVYTVFVNPVGGPPDRPCAGTTAVYGPDGTTTGTTTQAETVLLVDLDPAELQRVRGFLRMLAEVLDPELIQSARNTESAAGASEIEIVGACLEDQPTLADLIVQARLALRPEAGQATPAGRALAALLAGLAREQVIDR